MMAPHPGHLSQVNICCESGTDLPSRIVQSCAQDGHFGNSAEGLIARKNKPRQTPATTRIGTSQFFPSSKMFGDKNNTPAPDATAVSKPPSRYQLSSERFFRANALTAIALAAYSGGTEFHSIFCILGSAYLRINSSKDCSRRHACTQFSSLTAENRA